jgi:hypothetical protein
VAVTVEGDRDARVAHVRGEGFDVDARGDHQAGERVAALVQPDGLEFGFDSRRRGTLAQSAV